METCQRHDALTTKLNMILAGVGVCTTIMVAMLSLLVASVKSSSALEAKVTALELRIAAIESAHRIVDNMQTQQRGTR